MATQPPTTTIGKYQILGLVGEGAMGAVYRALDPVLQRPVAIKVMSDAVAREQELRERFLREAQAAGSLQHPNVVTIYDFGEVDGHLFIAMEFLDGEDLEALLARRVDLSLAAKLGIAIDVLGGLSYAHRRGIVHRDIKPANIRITEDERAKIMDFGVAHLTSQKMTRTGMTMGTPNYMAPEQVAGGTIGPHTDVFSLGAVLYELLTHRKPFAAETLHAVLFKIVSEPTPLASTLAPEVPPELDAIVARALAKETAERYQSAAEMANDLTALRASLGAFAGARQVSSSISLNARLASAGRTAPAPAAVGPNVLDPGAPAATVPSGKGGVGRGALALTGALALVGLGVGAWALTRGGPPPASDASAALATVDASASTGMPAPLPPAPPSAPAAAPPSPAPPPPSTSTTPAPSTAAPAATVRPRPTAPAAPTVAASAAVQNVPAPTPRAPEVAATPAPTPPPTPAREAPPPAAPVAEPSANAAGEIAQTVARYARAISGRDLAAVRAAYPGITSAQEKNFERFFASVRELRASFTLSNLDVTGATADARLNGVYEFVTSAGQRERSPVTFQATFRRDGSSWVLAAVR